MNPSSTLPDPDEFPVEEARRTSTEAWPTIDRSQKTKIPLTSRSGEAPPSPTVTRRRLKCYAERWALLALRPLSLPTTPLVYHRDACRIVGASRDLDGAAHAMCRPASHQIAQMQLLGLHATTRVTWDLACSVADQRSARSSHALRPVLLTNDTYMLLSPSCRARGCLIALSIWLWPSWCLCMCASM